MFGEWKLGIDLITDDNLLDGISFNDLITAVHCNCRKISTASVVKELHSILDQRMQDMWFLLENNMDAIIKEAKRGRK